MPPSPFDKTHQTIDVNPEKEVNAFSSEKKSQLEEEPDVLPTEQKDDFELIEPEMVSIVTSDNIPKFEEVPDPLVADTEPDLDFDTPAAAHRAKHEQNIDEMV